MKDDVTEQSRNSLYTGSEEEGDELTHTSVGGDDLGTAGEVVTTEDDARTDDVSMDETHSCENTEVGSYRAMAELFELEGQATVNPVVDSSESMTAESEAEAQRKKCNTTQLFVQDC